jgi:hypothetical protein
MDDGLSGNDNRGEDGEDSLGGSLVGSAIIEGVRMGAVGGIYKYPREGGGDNLGGSFVGSAIIEGVRMGAVGGI